jgi:hypothetical protein
MQQPATMQASEREDIRRMDLDTMDKTQSQLTLLDAIIR